MASHHHHCRPHNSHPTATTTYSCCCSCSCSCCTPSHHPALPDPLLQSIASNLLHSPYLNHPPYNLHNPQTQYHPHQPHQQNQQFRDHQQQQQTHPIVSSLLRRITALESSLHHHSSASYSVRDAAARTIQTHFRAFLVRRSRTLRQLKDLAFIKSTLNTLKSSLSNNNQFDSPALSNKAMGLLLKLDSIQGGDPIITDGKRSISRELIRFIEFIDVVSVKRHELSSRALKNARFSGNGNKSRVLKGDLRMGTTVCGDLGKDHRELRGRVGNARGFSRVSEEGDEEDVELENPSIFMNGKCDLSQIRSGGLAKRHGGVQTKVKKNVRFAENGNVSRFFRSTHEPVSSGIDSIDAETELLDHLCREVEEIGGFSKTEDDEEAHSDDDDGETDPERSLRTEGNYEERTHYEGEDESFVFSPPLPVKMESRADLMKKRKTVKVVN